MNIVHGLAAVAVLLVGFVAFGIMGKGVKLLENGRPVQGYALLLTPLAIIAFWLGSTL